MEEISSGEVEDTPAFDRFAWPLCAKLSQARITWFAPDIPRPVLATALLSYLDLAEDEVLLAIVASAAEQVATQSCALTTKRLYWAGVPRREARTSNETDSPATSTVASPPPQCESIAYKDLPETIALTGLLSRAIDIGEGRTIGLGGNAALQLALTAYLTRVRALVRGEEALPELPPAVVDQARSAWPAVLEADAEARALQAEIRKYHAQTAIAPRGLVTYLIATACVLVYVAMVLKGVSPFQPESTALINWGANFGPSIVFNGQLWRLLTSLFLHIGLLHLALNMWCLVTTGPVVERFFGPLGFAALYLLSGIGGGIASLLVHPTIVCAGASGAIFGVFGGLLGYLAIRHGEFPAAILRPMRSGIVGFLGYNVLYGFTNPEIDMAAHLGGLATGFLVGLPLAGGGITRRDRVGLLRRTALIAALTVAIGLLTGLTIRHVRSQILADPNLGQRIQADLGAAPAFNQFFVALNPRLQDFDRIAKGIEQVGEQLDRGDVPASQIERTLDGLTADSDALGRSLGSLPVANEEIRTMFSRLVSAKTHQRHALELLRRLVKDRDKALIDGPDGVHAALTGYVKDFEELRTLRDAYIQAHHLVHKNP